MTNDNKYIHNVATDEILIIELSEDEQTLRNKEIKETAKIEAKAKAEAETKAVQRQLILDKLGLTSDEAKLLIG